MLQKLVVNFFADAVRKNRLTAEATNAEIETVMKEWLRTSGDRSGGRRQREVLKRPRAVESSSGDETTEP